ncbi:MAG: TetR/AcrR family transcriptional regulator [Deltaproteobacteria bacterium]|nr:TetR/AcrR family transcriptional regulator [Deltaproteobacteria bacterium]
MVVARSAAVPDVRAQVLATASRLFAARGFEATTVQAVADEVGVTKQAVLHHFPSKDVLRDAVLDAIVAHWNDTLPRLLLAATASEDRFEGVLGELRRFFSTDPDRARLVLREVLDRPVETTRTLRGPLRAWLTAIAGYIRAGQERGRHWADVDPEAYLVLVLLLVVVAVSALGVGPAALDGNGAERWERELGRLAHASLFRPDGAPARSLRSGETPASTVGDPRGAAPSRPTGKAAGGARAARKKKTSVGAPAAGDSPRTARSR